MLLAQLIPVFHNVTWHKWLQCLYCAQSHSAKCHRLFTNDRIHSAVHPLERICGCTSQSPVVTCLYQWVLNKSILLQITGGYHIGPSGLSQMSFFTIHLKDVGVSSQIIALNHRLTPNCHEIIPETGNGESIFTLCIHAVCFTVIDYRLTVWGWEISSRRWRRPTLKPTNYWETSLR